jgi:hypothetical protein
MNWFLNVEQTFERVRFAPIAAQALAPEAARLLKRARADLPGDSFDHRLSLHLPTARSATRRA